MAKAPVNAVNKAKDAAAKAGANARGTDAVVANGEVNPTATKVATTNTTAKTAATQASVSPGLAASADLDAAAEASPAFRSFVANAKINGVFQGSPPRAMINGRLARAGEVVETGLGVVFDGIDSDRKVLIFKDRSGAVVSRKY
jgi:hypothetical protein